MTPHSLTTREGHSYVAFTVRTGDITEAKYESGTQTPHTLLSYDSAAVVGVRIDGSLDKPLADWFGPAIGRFTRL
jgi:hypothetical protein